MKTAFRLLSVACVLGCATAVAAESAQPPLVAASRQTEPSASGEVDSAAWIPGGTGRPARVVGTAALGGLELYGADGKRIGTTPAGEAGAVAAMPGLDFGDGSTTLVAAIDTTGNFLRLFRVRGDALEDAAARAIPLGFAAEGLCLARNPVDVSVHAIVVGDGGEIDQQVVFAAGGGKLDARPVRRIRVPSTVKQCAADDTGTVYAIEETTALWRFDADPEADLSARVVDAPRLGQLGKKAKGVAVLDGGDGLRWLLAADTDDGKVNVYDRARHDAFLGAFRVGGTDGEAVAEPGMLAASAQASLPGAPHGTVLVADGDAADYKLVGIDAIARTLSLPLPAAGRTPVVAPAARRIPTVVATVESAPVRSYGDAADDPAIWGNPDDPAASLVVATDKKAGLYLYDMQGKVLQFRPDGKLNNVDLRDGFDLGGEKIVLVTASNRTDKTIAIYRLDPAKRELVDIADGPQPTGLGDPYGLCMYHSARDGRTYVFVNGDDTRFRQWELVAHAGGKVGTKLVRDLHFDSQTEGCTADDDNGALYVDEEDVALWRLPADPDGGDARTAIARVADNPALKDDLEGLGIYDLGGGRGYIVVSSQGNDTYAVFRREGDHAYLGSFAVVADPARGIDGISETDGLEVSSRNLGPGFGHGTMVAQDGRNVMPAENQNYKYVPWDAIARALGLETRPAR